MALKADGETLYFSGPIIINTIILILLIFIIYFYGGSYHINEYYK